MTIEDYLILSADHPAFQMPKGEIDPLACWPATKIKSFLFDHRMSVSDLARALGARREEVSMTIHRSPGRYYGQLRQQIADHLNRMISTERKAA